MRPLTERQIAALKRLAKEGGREHFSPDLAKQLDKRGVAELTGHKYTRTEWNRPVATLWEVRLTGAGRNLLAAWGVAIEKSLAEKMDEFNKANDSNRGRL